MRTETKKLRDLNVGDRFYFTAGFGSMMCVAGRRAYHAAEVEGYYIPAANPGVLYLEDGRLDDEVVPAEEGQTYEEAIEAATSKLTIDDFEIGERFKRSTTGDTVFMKTEAAVYREHYTANAVAVENPESTFEIGTLWRISPMEALTRIEETNNED